MTTATQTPLKYACSVPACEAGPFTKSALQAHFNGKHGDMHLSTKTVDLQEVREALPDEGAGAPDPQGPDPTGQAQPTVEKPKTKPGDKEKKDPPKLRGIAAPPEMLKEVPEDLAALASPRDQFEGMARQLGMQPPPAAAVANYLNAAYDLEDPRSIWQGLSECTEIGVAMRRKLWRSWCSWAGLQAPPDLTSEIDAQTQAALGGTAAPASRPRGKRFTVVNGEIMPTEDDDEGGLSWTQAVQQVQLQMQRDAQSESGGGMLGLVASMMQENGASQRKAMELQDGREARQIQLLTAPREDRSGPLVTQLMQVQQEVVKAQIELVKAQTDGQVSLLREQMATQNTVLAQKLDEMTRAIVGARTATPAKGFFDQLFEQIPEARTRFLDSLMGGSEKNAIVLQTADGKIPLDAWEKVEAVKLKREGFGVLRQAIPDFLMMGKDLAGAYREMAEATRAQGGTVVQAVPGEVPQNQAQAKCAGCGLLVLYGKGIMAFECPRCKTVQTPEGRVLTPEEIQRAAGQAPQHEKPAPAGPVLQVKQPLTEVREEGAVSPEGAAPVPSGDDVHPSPPESTAIPLPGPRVEQPAAGVPSESGL